MAALGVLGPLWQGLAGADGSGRLAEVPLAAGVSSCIAAGLVLIGFCQVVVAAVLLAVMQLAAAPALCLSVGFVCYLILNPQKVQPRQSLHSCKP